MTHYICTGVCHGESKNSGVCQADDCNKKGQALLACDCEDWNHDKVLSEHLTEAESVSDIDDEDEDDGL